LEHKAIRGLPWAFVGYLGSRAITVAATLVLAHLLVPSDFGLVALALAIVAIPNTLSEIGLGSTLVARQDLDRHQKGTILTLLVGLGAALALLTAAFAPLAAVIFDETRLTPVLVALSATILITGLTGFYEWLMERELEFRRRFFAELSRTLTYATTALVLAALGAGVWSLVVGQLAGFGVYAVALLLLAPYRVPPAYSRAAAADVLDTGRDFFVQGWVSFLSETVHYLAVGRAFGAAQLAYYSMAFRLSELPSFAIAEPVATVTFPGFARMRHAGQEVAPSYLTTLGLVALIACPLGVLLSATAAPFVALVLGTKWLGAIGPLSVLGIWAAVRPVQVTMGWLLNSLGFARVVGSTAAIMLAPLLVGLVLAGIFGSITTVSWVMLGDLLLGTVIFAVIAQRRAGILPGQHWQALRASLIGCAGAWPAARVVADSLSGQAAIVGLATSTAVGLAVYVVVVSLVEPGILRVAAGRIRSALRRPSEAAAAPS
jgi:lipopolysaccharide exporter